MRALERVHPAGAEEVRLELAQSEFEPINLAAGSRLEPVRVLPPESLPPRKWLYGRSVIAENISVLVAPGGTGKSALIMAEAVAMATGRELLSGDKPRRDLKIWYHNGEDTQDEQQRRLRPR